MIHFLFIDATVEDIDTLQAHIRPETVVHRISDNVDGIDYITQVLDDEQSCSAHSETEFSDVTISIVAHGIAGAWRLGNAVLNVASLERYRDRIQKWFSGTPLHPGHHDRLQLYSCDGVTSAEGQEFLKCLHQITYATVYASTTKLGNVLRGKNWPLDILVNSWNARLIPLLGYAQPPAPESPFIPENVAA